jgi:hypothetical protein
VTFVTCFLSACQAPGIACFFHLCLRTSLKHVDLQCSLQEESDSTGNNVTYTNAFGPRLFDHWLLKLKVKEEMYNDEPRIKLNIIKAEKVSLNVAVLGAGGSECLTKEAMGLSGRTFSTKRSFVP